MSLATLSGPGDSRTHPRRVGSRVSGSTVVFIGHNPRRASPAVWLSGARGLCQSLVFSPAPASSETTSAAHSEQRQPSRPRERASRPRVFPEIRDGQVLGVRVMGITADSLPALLGLANGDRLERVNGLDLTTPENALLAYTRLRNASRLDVDLERRGKKLRITYSIR